jgi:hypothetical protein
MLNRPAHFMGKKGTHLLSRHRELLSSPLLLHHLRWFGPATYTRDKYRAAAVQYIAQRSSASGEVLATHNHLVVLSDHATARPISAVMEDVAVMLKSCCSCLCSSGIALLPDVCCRC